MTYAAIRNRQRKEALIPVRFQPVHWTPQIQVTFNRDISGWLDRDRGVKWSFSKGQTVYIDHEHAIEFIVKGYCSGELPRRVSEDEKAEIRSTVTVIGMGDTRPQSRNGNG